MGLKDASNVPRIPRSGMYTKDEYTRLAFGFWLLASGFYLLARQTRLDSQGWELERVIIVVKKTEQDFQRIQAFSISGNVEI